MRATYEIEWYVWADGATSGKRGSMVLHTKRDAVHLANELMHTFGSVSGPFHVKADTPRQSWESADRRYSLTLTRI